MAKTLSLDVTSIKFEDNETDLKFIASDKGIIVSDSTLSATIKIKQVDIGYLKSISAKWVNNHIVISSGDLSDLPVGSYLVELWLGSPSGYEIYPDSGFVRLYIKENATGISGNLVSSITLGEFQKQFSDLAEELSNNVADGIVDTTKDYTWTGTHTFNKKIIAPAGVQGNADTVSKLQTPRTIGGVTFDGGSNIDLPGVNKAGNQDTSGRAANATNADHANNSSNADLATKAIALRDPHN